MRKKSKLGRILISLAAACLIFPAVVPASEATITFTAGKRAVFTNHPDDDPALSVKKTVVSEISKDLVPTDDFRFTIKVDNELYANQPYYIFDTQGNRLYNYGTSEEPRMTAQEDTSKTEVPFVTSESGGFTLRDGWVARFFDISAGSLYEVAEGSTENYYQVKPAADQPAKGTMPQEGVEEEFINEYDEPEYDGETTKLKVRKELYYPEGFKTQANGEFTFTIKLAETDTSPQEALSDYSFSITDTLTGKTVSSGNTDANGTFTLLGGQTATFRDLPIEYSYYVEETNIQSGWRKAKESKAEGTLAPTGNVAVFTNTNASFGVTKSISGGNVDTPFTFTLTDGSGAPVENAPYVLYKSNGTPVSVNTTTFDSTQGEFGSYTASADIPSLSTDSNGQFSIKPGQTAIFLGMDNGDIYNIAEEPVTGYNQITPASASGYTDQEVGFPVQIHEFVNEKDPDSAILSVKKVVKNEAEDGSDIPSGDKFIFLLEEKQGEDTYAPVANMEYTLSSTVSSGVHHTAGDQNLDSTNAGLSNGCFKLGHKETAIFTGLAKGRTYRVTELEGDLLRYYPEDEKPKTADLTSDKTLVFNNIFTNTEYKKTVIYISKKNEEGQPLSGAVFTLYSDKALTKAIETLTTGASGEIHFQELKPGTYYLKETKSPSGYSLLTNPIEVECGYAHGHMEYKVNDTAITSKASTDPIYYEEDGNKVNLHISVTNHKGFSLPMTGTAGMLLLAVIIFASAVLISLMIRFSGKKKS